MNDYFVYDGESTTEIDREHYKPTDIVIHCDFDSAKERELYNDAKDENILLSITQQRSACSGIFRKPELESLVPTKVRIVLEYAKIPASREEKLFVICENKDSVAILSSYLQRAFPKANIFSATCSMGGKRRDDIRYMFELSKGFSILVSTNIFTQGVNLACANHTIIYDVWWNGVLADQGKSRCERPSQKKSVFTVQLVIANTIEESIWNVAHQKRVMRKQLVSGDLTNDISLKITSELANQILKENGSTIIDLLKECHDIYINNPSFEQFKTLVPETHEITPLVIVPELVDLKQQELLRARRMKEFSTFFKSISIRAVPSTQRIMKGRYILPLSTKRQKRIQPTDDLPIRYEQTKISEDIFSEQKRRRTLKI
jgi:superfamily II DNA or RNA helicase